MFLPKLLGLELGCESSHCAMVDVETLMNEHNLSREEAVEVVRQMKQPDVTGT